MPRIKLILNPASDRGRTARIGETLQALLHERAQIEAARGIHYELHWEITERPGQATDITQEAARDGYDIVVAVGGDGTVHEVVNGLMAIDSRKRPRLGVIPVGSGNDFAHNIKLPDKVEDAVHCLFGDATRSTDIGLVKDGSGRQAFWDNTVGIGFSGAVNIAAKKITWVYGFLVYFLAVVETIITRPLRIPVRVQVDDQLVQDRKIAMIAVCNGPREGGGFPVAPNAVMDDGHLTYMFLRDVNRAQMFYFLPIVMAANHLKYTDFFQEGNATTLKVQADQALLVHVDGEMWGPPEAAIRDLEFSLIPAAVQVMCNC